MSTEQPNGEELIKLSKKQNLISKKLYLMTTFVDGGSVDSVLEHLEDHLAYWDEMEKEGNMFAAGPFLPVKETNSWEGNGLVIISASSYQEANTIAEEDPMHKAGAREFELSPWLLNHMATNSI